MPKIEWDQTCAVGINFVDDQHRKLFSIVGDFDDAVESGKSKNEILNIFDELIRYTHDHFAEEEAMMESNGYENFSAHKAIHDQLKGSVAKLKKDFDGGLDGTAEAASHFFRHWLKSHIMDTDMKYVAPMKAKGVA